MAIDLANKDVAAEPHGTPQSLRTPAPQVDRWPPGIRVAVLLLSVVVAWAILAGVGYLVCQAIVWGRS